MVYCENARVGCDRHRSHETISTVLRAIVTTVHRTGTLAAVPQPIPMAREAVSDPDKTVVLLRKVTVIPTETPEEQAAELADEALPVARRDSEADLSAPDTQQVEEYLDTDEDSTGIIGTAVVEGGASGGARGLGQLAVVAAALLMAGISVVRAYQPGLWADELATWGMTTVAWEDMWRLVNSTDMAIGPYYYLIRGWTQLVGDSDFALRAPSILAMVGAAAVIAAIGTRLTSARVGMLAGAIFAVLPITSRYAQEARPYALVVFAAALSTLLLLRAVSRPGFWRFAAYFLAVAILGLLHTVALLMLVPHLVLVLARHRNAFWGWLVATVLAVAPAGGLLYLAFDQRTQVAWLEAPTAQMLSVFPRELFGTSLIGGAIFVLAGLAVSFRMPGLVYSAWALIPVALLFAASQWTSLWLPRYLLFTVPAWALLAALVLGRAPLVRGVLIVVAIAFLGVPAQLQMRASDGHSQDSREVAELIIANLRPEDGIVFGTSDRGGAWVGRDIVNHYIPPDLRPEDLLVTQEPRTNGKVLAIECPDAELSDCLDNTPRLWVFRLGNHADPLAGLPREREAVLREQYVTTRTWHPKGFTLGLLVRKAA